MGSLHFHMLFPKMACLCIFLILPSVSFSQSWQHPDFDFQGLVSYNGNIAAYTTLPGDDNTTLDLNKITIEVFGIGNEVGDIANIHVFSSLTVPIFLRFADAILTSPDGSQNYVTLDTTDFLLVLPNTPRSIIRQGTCYEPSKKHLTAEDAFNSPDQWIRRPNTYDHLQSTDRIFELSETIYEVVDHLTRTGSLHTPLHGNPSLERNTIALHTHKYVFSRDMKLKNPYVQKDFIQFVNKDFREVTGRKLNQLNSSLQTRYQRDINNIWSTIVTTAKIAKARVDELPQKLKVETQGVKSFTLVNIEQIKRGIQSDWGRSGAVYLQYQIAENQGFQFFNLWTLYEENPYQLIRNFPLTNSGKNILTSKGFLFPTDMIGTSEPLTSIPIAYTIDDKLWNGSTFPDSFSSMSILPSIKYISRGNKDLKPLEEIFPEGTRIKTPPDPEIDFPIEEISRKMPNMDMDAAKYPPTATFAGDENGCVTAAFSNSMMWLRDSNQLVRDTINKYFMDEKHTSELDDHSWEEVVDKDSSKIHHSIFEEASRLMKREDRKGVWMQDFIRGKQAFMDKYKLPIKVKFQSLRVEDKKICPETDLYGHCAENQSKTVTEESPNAKIDINWIHKELKDDEDVEMNLYCYQIDEEGNLVRDENGKIKPAVEHCVNLSGIMTNGKEYHFLTLADDTNQMESGGMNEEQVQIIVENESAHPNVRGMLRLHNLSYAGDDEVCYIMQVVSESVDPSITFEKKTPELDQEESFKFLDDYWRKSNLTDNILKQDRKFPWWGWTAGGSILTGGTIYLLTQPDDTHETLLKDDALTLPCLATGSINVLKNDSGNKLELIEIEVKGNGTATFNKEGEIIIKMASEDLIIHYTVKDKDGQLSHGLLYVTILPESINAVDDIYEVHQGIPLVRNILDNDIGSNIQLKNNTNPTGGLLNINSTGEITFQSDSNFVGTTSFHYTIEGPCGGMDSATVTITVIDTSCDFNVQETIENELCEISNGSITLKVSPDDNYIFEWSNGANSKDIMDIPSSNYAVTISLPDINCDKSFNFQVEQELFEDYVQNLKTIPYACPVQGEISFDLNSPGSGNYQITVVSSHSNQTINTSQNQVNLSDHLTILPGSYELTIRDTSLGEICSQTITQEIEDQSRTLQLNDDHFQYNGPDTLYANVLDNDTGPNLEVIDFKTPSIGLADVAQNGALSFFYDDSFVGQISFYYVTRDTCDRTDTADIFIDILKQDCEFEFNIVATPAMCGQDDGSAEVTFGDTTVYKIRWSTGDTTRQIDSVGAGDYSVIVTDTNACSITKEFTIKNTFQRIADTVLTKSANCRGEGELTIIIDSTTYDTFNLKVSGPNIDLDTNLSTAIVGLHEWLKIDSGSYQILLKESGIPDSCCQELTIEIGQDTANFKITIDTEPAFCGAATGSARAHISPIGNYIYQWSSGDTGSDIQDLAPGSYELSVTDEESGCTKSQEFEIEEDLVSEFVEDHQIIPEICSVSGDILLTLTTPASGNMRITGFGPGVSINITAPAGVIRFSDYVMINDGPYQLTIWDEGVGPTCSERLEITVPNESEDIDLQVLSTQEPSSPSASDGSITCLIDAVPFSSPYQIYLNGMFWGMTSSSTFTITNLSLGVYNIYVVSNNECLSNEVSVEFDLSPLNISFRQNLFTRSTQNQRIPNDPGKTIFNKSDYIFWPYLHLRYEINSVMEAQASTGILGNRQFLSIGGGTVHQIDNVTLHCGSKVNWMPSAAPQPLLYFQMEWPILNQSHFYIDYSVYPINPIENIIVNGGLSLDLK